MNTIKASALTLFIAVSAFTATAQERYEYMIITYSAVNGELFISTDTGEYKAEVIPRSDKKPNLDLSPALIRIRPYSDQGWVVYQNSMISVSTIVFHLRRPMN